MGLIKTIRKGKLAISLEERNKKRIVTYPAVDVHVGPNGRRELSLREKLLLQAPKNPQARLAHFEDLESQVSQAITTLEKLRKPLSNGEITFPSLNSIIFETREERPVKFQLARLGGILRKRLIIPKRGKSLSREEIKANSDTLDQMQIHLDEIVIATRECIIISSRQKRNTEDLERTIREQKERQAFNAKLAKMRKKS